MTHLFVLLKHNETVRVQRFICRNIVVKFVFKPNAGHCEAALWIKENTSTRAPCCSCGCRSHRAEERGFFKQRMSNPKDAP